MDEEQTNEEGKKAESVTTEDGGDKQKTPQSIIDANLAAKRLEDANAKHAELLAKQEDMIARKILGGQSEAGQSAEKKKETDEEYADRFSKGEVNPLTADVK